VAEGECDVDKIVKELLETGSNDEIVILLYLSKHDAVLFSSIQLALTGGRYYASGTWTRSLVHDLVRRGLVRELNVTIRRKRYKLYALTECGMRVAKVLSRVFM
jgi:predicted 2-oxoglutarate/Fe(II)-dependent dioxygenase YbiX